MTCALAAAIAAQTVPSGLPVADQAPGAIVAPLPTSEAGFVVERLGKTPFEKALTEAVRLSFRPIVMLGGIVSSAVLTFFIVPADEETDERRVEQLSAVSDKGRLVEIGEL